MKRHSVLIELSQEHHHTLALCLRILRAPEQNHQTDITKHYVDLEQHFIHEETLFAPLWDKLNRPELRRLFREAQFDRAEWNTTFATLLRDHARFEERELFPAMEQNALPPE